MSEAPEDVPAALAMSGVDALLLDMDGTLVDSEHVSDLCWGRWCRARGKDLADVLVRSRGRQAVEVMAAVAPELEAWEVAADAAAFEAAERLETEGVVATPGAAALLQTLHRLAVPHALVTSAGRALALVRMAAAGLPLPPVQVCGDDVVDGKPHPEGYLRAAERLGVDPARCVVLEDATAGVAAGLAAGARVIAVGPALSGLKLDGRTPDGATPDGATRDGRAGPAMWVAAPTDLRVRAGADGWTVEKWRFVAP